MLGHFILCLQSLEKHFFYIKYGQYCHVGFFVFVFFLESPNKFSKWEEMGQKEKQDKLLNQRYYSERKNKKLFHLGI